MSEIIVEQVTPASIEVIEEGVPGPIGPQGPQGPQGIPGPEVVTYELPWTIPTLVNGFRSFGDPHAPVRWKRDMAGNVFIGGVAVDGPLTASYPGTVVYTLPAGCRPSKVLIQRGSDADDTPIRINIFPTGDVTVQTGTGYVCFDGISFPSEDL
jgi:hypothetical protein